MFDKFTTSALSRQSLLNAERFIRVLPGGIPMPQITADPDGSVSLDWIASRNRIFSLSIGPTDQVALAWLDGCDKGYAVVDFDGETVPLRVLQAIESIIS